VPGKTKIKSTNTYGGERIESVWLSENKIQVTQIVEVIPGEPIDVGPVLKRYLDTVVVRYQLENRSTDSRKVGLRFLLDTMIGFMKDGTPNDGVPFTVPGVSSLVVDSYDLSPADKVPAFVEVLQNPDLNNPGIVARLNLKLGGSLEAPSRVSLTRWKDTRDFDIPMEHFKGQDRTKKPDSAVVIYWKEEELKPGSKRELGFSYGLGSVASKTGHLGITVGGDFTLRKEITVTAYVSNPQPGEKVTLSLPKELELVGGAKTQDVPAAGADKRAVPVTWRVRSNTDGTFELSVTRTSDPGNSQKRKVQIRKKSESIF
jgi:hypothetical protein